MRPGYYIVVKNDILSNPAGNFSQRVRLRRGDWLVTDGVVLGRFDKDIEWDWLPVEWVRGNPVIIDQTIANELDAITIRVPLQKMKTEFGQLSFVEPGEPSPDMPTPSLGQLSSYLKARRTLVAYTYQRSI